jgi:hypothetical protein
MPSSASRRHRSAGKSGQRRDHPRYTQSPPPPTGHDAANAYGIGTNVPESVRPNGIIPPPPLPPPPDSQCYDNDSPMMTVLYGPPVSQSNKRRDT